MTKPRLDKLAFYKDLGYVPHAGQLEIHRATELRRVVACGVRWGKTKCAAMEGLAAAMQPAEYSVGWVVGPNYDLADRVFREILLTARKHLSHYIVSAKESEGSLKLRNLGGGIAEIRAKSAESPDSLLGEGLDWLIVDEASRIKPSIWEGYLSQRLIDKRGWALLISTPKGKGYFYSLFKRGQGSEPNWRSWNQPSWLNPKLDRALIEDERRKLPERVFHQEYGAEFIEGTGSVFRNVRECATGEWREREPGRRYFAGLDLARVEDFTVLAILDDQKHLVAVDRFQRLDWSIQLQRIKTTLGKFGNPEVYVDSTGAGQPVYEQLLRDGVQALGFQFSKSTKDALIGNLAIRLEQKEIVIPKPELWPEGIDELEEYQYSVTDAGNFTSAAAGSGHDDIVIALALAAWHLRRREDAIDISCAPILFTYDDEY